MAGCRAKPGQPMPTRARVTDYFGHGFLAISTCAPCSPRPSRIRPLGGSPACGPTSKAGDCHCHRWRELPDSSSSWNRPWPTSEYCWISGPDISIGQGRCHPGEQPRSGSSLRGCSLRQAARPVSLFRSDSAREKRRSSQNEPSEEGLPGTETLAELFGVSSGAMVLRLQQLQLL